MHNPVYEPAAEIKRQYANKNSEANTGTSPVYKTKILRPAPVRQFHNKNGQDRVNDQVNDSKPKIDQRVVDLTAFVLKWEKRNSAFYDPEKKKASYQDGHSLHRAGFQIFKIMNEAIPHTGQQLMQKLRRKTGKGKL